MVICEGFSAAISKVKSFHQDSLEFSLMAALTPPSSPPPGGVAGPAPSTAGARSRSDQLVSRMKMFFQGSAASEKEKRGKSPNRKDARRYED